MKRDSSNREAAKDRCFRWLLKMELKWEVVEQLEVPLYVGLSNPAVLDECLDVVVAAVVVVHLRIRWRVAASNSGF